MRRQAARAEGIGLDLGRGVQRLPVGIQVVLGAVGLLVVVAASLVAAILVVMHVNHDEVILDARDAAYGQAITATALAENTIGNDERSFLQSGDTTLLAQTDQQIDSAQALFDTAATSATNAAERQAIKDAQTSFAQWIRAVRQDLSTFQAGHHQQAITTSNGATRTLRDTLDESTIRAQTLCTAAIQSAASKIAVESSRSVKILLAALAAALAAGIIIAYWLIRTIVRPVYRILDFLAPESPNARP